MTIDEMMIAKRINDPQKWPFSNKDWEHALLKLPTAPERVAFARKILAWEEVCLADALGIQKLPPELKGNASPAVEKAFALLLDDEESELLEMYDAIQWVLETSDPDRLAIRDAVRQLWDDLEDDASAAMEEFLSSGDDTLFGQMFNNIVQGTYDILYDAGFKVSDAGDFLAALKNLGLLNEAGATKVNEMEAA